MNLTVYNLRRMDLQIFRIISVYILLHPRITSSNMFITFPVFRLSLCSFIEGPNYEFSASSNLFKLAFSP